MTTANATIDLTTFRAHAAEHLERLAASGGVEYITVDGQTKGVVMAPGRLRPNGGPHRAG